MTSTAQTMKARSICVVVPCYNNVGTVVDVLRQVSQYTPDIIFVNDGSTDGSLAAVQGSGLDVDVVDLPHNGGKGKALLAGFARAKERGFQYAITLDSDGQHYADDLPSFVDECDGSLIVGRRIMGDADRSQGSSFANKFSNFWFTVQTWRRLSDTQTGYRLYPLEKLRWTRLITSRYEAELEMLVFAAWHGVKIKEIPIKVYYPPRAERVSHFRPFKDFGRISLLNTALCLGAAIYGWPMTLWHKLAKK